MSYDKRSEDYRLMNEQITTSHEELWVLTKNSQYGNEWLYSSNDYLKNIRRCVALVRSIGIQNNFTPRLVHYSQMLLWRFYAKESPSEYPFRDIIPIAFDTASLILEIASVKETVSYFVNKNYDFLSEIQDNDKIIKQPTDQQNMNTNQGKDQNNQNLITNNASFPRFHNSPNSSIYLNNQSIATNIQNNHCHTKNNTNQTASPNIQNCGIQNHRNGQKQKITQNMHINQNNTQNNNFLNHQQLHKTCEIQKHFNFIISLDFGLRINHPSEYLNKFTNFSTTDNEIKVAECIISDSFLCPCCLLHKSETIAEGSLLMACGMNNTPQAITVKTKESLEFMNDMLFYYKNAI